jgi:hypothetical protein
MGEIMTLEYYHPPRGEIERIEYYHPPRGEIERISSMPYYSKNKLPSLAYFNTTTQFMRRKSHKEQNSRVGSNV